MQRRKGLRQSAAIRLPNSEIEEREGKVEAVTHLGRELHRLDFLRLCLRVLAAKAMLQSSVRQRRYQRDAVIQRSSEGYCLQTRCNIVDTT
jgi:hypothetical protein